MIVTSIQMPSNVPCCNIATCQIKQPNYFQQCVYLDARLEIPFQSFQVNICLIQHGRVSFMIKKPHFDATTWPSPRNLPNSHVASLLEVGDCVRIQNQTGHYPRRWEQTESFVEVRQYDQYVIQADGSGRVTLRNRKFLRKFNPVQPNMPFDRLIQAWQKPAAPDILPPYESTSNDAPPVKEQSPDTTNSNYFHCLLPRSFQKKLLTPPQNRSLNAMTL